MTPTLADLPRWFIVAVAWLLGLLFGSFINVVIYRLPRDENIAFPGSHCPSCGKPIRAYDNLPVLSWVFLRGRARCCGARISPRYPLVELIGGLLGWAVADLIVFQLPLETPWYLVIATLLLNLGLGLALVAVAFIDLEHMLIPDEITMGGTALALLSAPLRSEVLALSHWSWVDRLTAGLGPRGGALAGTWLDSLLGAGFGFVLIWLPFERLYSLLRGKPGMGRGDAKLVMLAGAWFGWVGALFALLAGSVQGTAVALAVFAAKGRIEEPEAVRQQRVELLAAIEAAQGEERAALEEELALDPVGREPEAGLRRARLSFGPFLALATLEYLLFGAPLLTGYLGLFGP